MPLSRLVLTALGAANLTLVGVAHAQMIYPPQLLPNLRNSPLLVTPEAAKVQEFTGSLVYSYPIEAPPGTGGLTPALVLSYSSLTKATEYGWGWSLNLSRIERGTRFGPPTYNNSTDSFELDGERLVPDGRAGRFHRERSQFEKIEFVNVEGVPGGSWIVTKPDGTEFRYGYRPGARSRLINPHAATGDGDPNTADVFAWYLDEVVDPRDNSYRITYEEKCDDPSGDCTCSGGECSFTPVVVHVYPDTIQYTYRPSGTQYDSRLIDFTWEDRGYGAEPKDAPTTVRGGFVNRITRRLAEIRTSVSGQQATGYVFTYHTKTSASEPDQAPFSQLKTILRKGRDNTDFQAPTSFAYTRPTLSPTSTPSLPPLTSDRLDRNVAYDLSASHGGGGTPEATIADMNGDGLMDRIGVDNDGTWRIMRGAAPATATAPRFLPKEDWRWCNAAEVCTFTEPQDGLGERFFVGLLTHASSSGESLTWQIMDMNGDGLADYVEVDYDDNNNTTAFRVFLSKGDAFLYPELWQPPSHTLPASFAAKHSGLDNLDWAAQHLGFNYVFTQSGGVPESHARLIDVNGDGLPDHLLSISEDKWSVAINRGCAGGICGFYNGQEISNPAILDHLAKGAYGPPIAGTGPPALGMLSSQVDINADGMPDQVTTDAAGCISTEYNLLDLGITRKVDTCGLPASLLLVYPFRGLLDVNGDGWLDWVKNDVGIIGTASVYLGLGDGRFMTQAITAYTDVASSHHAVDFDNDGLVEIVVNDSVGWSTWDHGDPPGLLKTITNEYGGITDVTYRSTADFIGALISFASGGYSAENLAGTQITPLRSHYWVVGSVSVRDGRQGTASIGRAFAYAQPRFDDERRENAGLRMSEATTAGVTTRSIFHQLFKPQGLLQFQEVVTPANCTSGCTVHSGRSTTWTVATPLRDDSGAQITASSFARATFDETWVRQGANEQLKAAGRSYDPTFGNLLWEADYGPDGTASTGDEGLVTRYDYSSSPDTTAWLVSYPGQIRQETTSGVLLGRTRFFYDGATNHLTAPTKGLITQQSRMVDAGTELTETFAYDTDGGAPVGNLMKYWDARTPPTNPTPSLTIAYDNAYRSLMTSSMNALLQTTHYELSPLTGQLLGRIDPNGYMECVQEDPFGRLLAKLRHSSPQGIPQGSFADDCNETAAQFSYETFIPGVAPNPEIPIRSADDQFVRAVTWAVGQAGTPPDCDNTEANCIESLRYFDGLGREYFGATESEKANTPGGRYFRNRKEWGSRGEVVCEWLPERGCSSPTDPALSPNCTQASKYPIAYAGCAGSAQDRRVFEYDDLLRVTAQKHGGNTERAIEYAISDHDGVLGSLEFVEKLTIYGDSGNHLYRETARDRDGSVVSICENAAVPSTGTCASGSAARTIVTLDDKKRVIRVNGPDIILAGPNPNIPGATNPNIVSFVYDNADRRLQLVRPPSVDYPLTGPTWSWVYDANGNVAIATPPRGASAAVQYTYDKLNRLRFKDLSPFTTYTETSARIQGDTELKYDELLDASGGYGFNIGQLTREITDALNRTYNRSLGGLKTKTTSTFSLPESHVYALESEVDLLGRPKAKAFPDGESVKFVYEKSTNTEVSLWRYQAQSGTPLLDEILVHPSGGLEKITHAGPDIPTVRTYPNSQAQRLGGIEVGTSGSIQDLVFGYDLAGNVNTISNGSLEQEFWYDGNHRLVKSVDYRTSGGYGTIDYAYDNAGNMTRYGKDALRYGANGDLPDAVTTVYFNAYDASGLNTPTIDDPCPSCPGPYCANEVGTLDTNQDGIPNLCQAGDVTGDGQITVADIVAANTCISNNPTCTDVPAENPCPKEKCYRCDAAPSNPPNGQCDVADLVAINGAIFDNLYFKLTSLYVRPEGKPVWDATYSYAYDDDGRTISRNLGTGNQLTFDWDNEGRLIGIPGSAPITFTYDASGDRVRSFRTAGGVILDQLFVSPEYEVDLRWSTHSKHIFAGGIRAITITQAGLGHQPAPASGESQQHLFGDHLGSQRVVTTETGDIVQTTVTTPYGRITSVRDSEGESIPSTTPFLFTGHRYDQLGNVNLHYMGARYYDPKVGGFLSVDPAWVEGEALGRLSTSAVYLNSYAYASRRPTRMIDPDGRLDFIPSFVADAHSWASEAVQRVTYGFVQPRAPVIGGPDGRFGGRICGFSGSCQVMRGTSSPNIPGMTNFTATERTGSFHDETGYEHGRAASPMHPVEGVEKLEDLEPGFRQKARAVTYKMRANGWRTRLLWGRRTKEENDALVAKGTASRTSRHLDGEAMDLINRDDPYPDYMHFYYFDMEQAAKSEGLIWGGDFRSRWDPTHVEAPREGP